MSEGTPSMPASECAHPGEEGRKAAGCVLRFPGMQRFVSNLQRSILFYCDGLGFERDTIEHGDAAVPAKTLQSERLVLGGTWLELRAIAHAPGEPFAPSIAPVSSTAFQHFAVVTNDINAVIARLRPFEPTVISGDRPVRLPAHSGGVTAWKFRDPDGHAIELLQFPEGRGDPKWKRTRSQALTLGVDHSAISVVDIERSLAFYRDLLGFTCTARQVNQGPEQGLLDGLPASVVEVVALAPAGDEVPHLELLGYRLPAAQASMQMESFASDDADRMVFVISRLDGVLDRIDAHPSGRSAARRDCAATDCQSAEVRDPDGHLLLLMENRMPPLSDY